MIVISDDQRDDQMQVMAKTRRIFGDGGTELSNGYVTTPLCCPSRTTILTGLYEHNHGVLDNEGEDPFPHRTSLERELSRVGYRTGVFGKFINGWPQRRKPPHFDVSRLGYGSEPRRADRLTGSHVRSFLRSSENRDREPWLAVYAARAPHAPLVPLRKYERARVPKFEARPSYLERDISDKSATVKDKALEQVRLFDRHRAGKHWRGEERLLLGLDDQIGRTFRTLDRLDETPDTLVFYLSDNGYLLGEHRLLRKGAPYRESLEVPFFMRWPGRVEAGAVDDRMAANIDIAPTIYDAAGAAPSYPVDGHSLLGSHRREWALAEHQADPWYWAQVFDADSRYIETYGPRGNVTFREFYDLDRDPFERTSLFGARQRLPANPRVTASQAELRDARTCSGESCP